MNSEEGNFSTRYAFEANDGDKCYREYWIIQLTFQKKKCTSIQAGQNYKSNIFSRDENLTSQKCIKKQRKELQGLKKLKKGSDCKQQN